MSDAVSSNPPPVLPDSLDFGSFSTDAGGNKILSGPRAYSGGNTLIDLQDAFANSQNELSTKAKAALGLLIGDSSNLANVASYQAANSALMNLFGAQTQVLKQIFDKIEAMNRNL